MAVKKSIKPKTKAKTVTKQRSKKAVGAGWNWRPDLPVWILMVLAALSIPRIVLHDMHAVELDSFPYAMIAATPLIVYAGVALVLKGWRPFYTFMVLGVFLGITLAITHQLTWTTSWGENPPVLGGKLEGVLDPSVEGFVVRLFAVVSSLMTGLVMGAALGLIAIAAQRLRLSSSNS
jgi:hypothetical protein